MHTMVLNNENYYNVFLVVVAVLFANSLNLANMDHFDSCIGSIENYFICLKVKFNFHYQVKYLN